MCCTVFSPPRGTLKVFFFSFLSWPRGHLLQLPLMHIAGKFRLNWHHIFIDLPLKLVFFLFCIFFPLVVCFLCVSPANSAHTPQVPHLLTPHPHHHQGVRSLPVPALQPVRHTLVTANPSFHSSTHFLSSPFLRKIHFFLTTTLFCQGRT